MVECQEFNSVQKPPRQPSSRRAKLENESQSANEALRMGCVGFVDGERDLDFLRGVNATSSSKSFRIRFLSREASYLRSLRHSRCATSSIEGCWYGFEGA